MAVKVMVAPATGLPKKSRAVAVSETAPPAVAATRLASLAVSTIMSSITSATEGLTS